ncbi:MAG: DUF1080 domain-containing protein [Pirellulales bacterium]|nr:DUF1080 domain-containing protein [Pirellulales bacterium]
MAVFIVLAICTFASAADGEDWLELIGNDALGAWQGECGGWTVGGDAALDPQDVRALVAMPGRGVLISSLSGRAESRNLTSKQSFADQEIHIEFLVPKGSNAGVKFQGLYEIQIADSFGKAQPTASDCGGVYPRAELEPRYHTIDEGVPPPVNACKPAGEWQELDVVFRAPRFDAEGKKIEDARFVKVTLNGRVLHENIGLKWPTGHAWRKEKEVARGPLFLQGDHGPVAYRNLRIKAARE